eukprot:935294-Rhodomonas_salina.1
MEQVKAQILRYWPTPFLDHLRYWPSAYATRGTSMMAHMRCVVLAQRTCDGAVLAERMRAVPVYCGVEL